jgi:hypothetical protein
MIAAGLGRRGVGRDGPGCHGVSDDGGKTP